MGIPSLYCNLNFKVKRLSVLMDIMPTNAIDGWTCIQLERCLYTNAARLFRCTVLHLAVYERKHARSACGIFWP